MSIIQIYGTSYLQMEPLYLGEWDHSPRASDRMGYRFNRQNPKLKLLVTERAKRL